MEESAFLREKRLGLREKIDEQLIVLELQFLLGGKEGLFEEQGFKVVFEGLES